jgi:hypothetical protein
MLEPNLLGRLPARVGLELGVVKPSRPEQFHVGPTGDESERLVPVPCDFVGRVVEVVCEEPARFGSVIPSPLETGGLELGFGRGRGGLRGGRGGRGVAG